MAANAMELKLGWSPGAGESDGSLQLKAAAAATLIDF